VFHLYQRVEKWELQGRTSLLRCEEWHVVPMFEMTEKGCLIPFVTDKTAGGAG
jgi:hypothetical protein